MTVAAIWQPFLGGMAGYAEKCASLYALRNQSQGLGQVLGLDMFDRIGGYHCVKGTVWQYAKLFIAGVIAPALDVGKTIFDALDQCAFATAKIQESSWLISLQERSHQFELAATIVELAILVHGPYLLLIVLVDHGLVCIS
jgi:hypothetical protein